MNKKDCVLELYRIGSLQFGEFKLKSGMISPIYIDLRLLVSYPQFLEQIAQLMWDKVSHRHYDRVCGVPYTALPIATALSLSHDLPMVMRRKEVKDYGTKKVIEGSFEQGHNCLLIEDLITSGASIFETIEPLEKEGMQVTDIVVLLDRCQGGKKRIEERGYRLHSILQIDELLEILQNENKISSETVQNIYQFLQANPC
jgi:orotate phosphoribosyltransferase